MSDRLVLKRLEKLEEQAKQSSLISISSIPSDAKLLILTTHPELGGDVLVADATVAIVESKLRQAGLGHIQCLILSGLKVDATITRPDPHSALVYCDWLSEHGYQEAADKLRKFAETGKED